VGGGKKKKNLGGLSERGANRTPDGQGWAFVGIGELDGKMGEDRMPKRGEFGGAIIFVLNLRGGKWVRRGWRKGGAGRFGCCC